MAHSCGFTPLAVAYCVNADAYCTKSDVDAASNTADKAEKLLFVDANSVLNREAAIRNIQRCSCCNSIVISKLATTLSLQ